jgi:hypothetical protein
MAALIGGCIDFRKRGGAKNLDRMERYPFYEQIIGRLGSVRLAGEQPPKSVPRAQRYIEDQVAGSLQMLRKAMGPEAYFKWLRNIVSREDKLRPAHLAALDEYERTRNGKPRLNIAEIRKYCDAQAMQFEQPTVAEEQGDEPERHGCRGTPDEDRWECG